MALTGAPISAKEAWLAGLVSELVDDAQMQERALEVSRGVETDFTTGQSL